MKIVINYDLIEKAKFAKRGISLKRYAQTIVTDTALAAVAISPFILASGEPFGELGEMALKGLGIYAATNGVYSAIFSASEKVESSIDLDSLAIRLNDIYIDTNATLLMGSYPYKTEYNLRFGNSILPQLEQRKYIMVPVNNPFDNVEKSLVQEHIIGTRSYALSYGEPEKEKVYSYGVRKNIDR